MLLCWAEERLMMEGNDWRTFRVVWKVDGRNCTRTRHIGVDKGCPAL